MLSGAFAGWPPYCSIHQGQLRKVMALPIEKISRAEISPGAEATLEPHHSILTTTEGSIHAGQVELAAVSYVDGRDGAWDLP